MRSLHLTMSLLIPVLSLDLSCVHHTAEVVAPARPPAPHLPAPVADLYVRHVGRSTDVLVVQAMAGRPWEEVLSGAATTLALTLAARGAADLSTARWAAVRAGYPFPVLGFQVVHAPHDEVPALSLPATGDVGLVRARGPDDDIWLVLHGAGGPELPPIPREAAVGDFVALSGSSWRASNPYGVVKELGTGVVFDRAGEWLLQAYSGATILATLPVYVGESTPENPPFVGDLSGDNPEEATFNAVAAVWDWYGRDAPLRDSGMDSVARVLLRALSQGSAPEAAEVLLRRAGFVDGAAGAECEAESLRACIEQMWWSPQQRGVLAGEYASVGVATSNNGRGVRVVVLAAK